MTSRHDDPKRLGAWLAARRWYGDKSRDLLGAERVFHARPDVEGDPFDLEIVRLTFSEGQPSDYLLVTDPAIAGEDGVASERVRRWLLDSFLQRRSVAGEGSGELRFTVVEANAIDTLAGEPSRLFRGEQSNTSVVFGEGAMLKLFRRLRGGENPEVEIGRFLTQETPFEAFPKLYGTIELYGPDGATTVGALQAFVPSVGDAWSWVIDRASAPETRSATVEAARQLGRRTGEMHRALAMGSEPAFAPELASAAYAEVTHREALVELEDTISQLRRRGVGDAETLGGALATSLGALERLEGTMITRIHGDYHLGQVLRTRDDDFAILDFEGEPSRPLEERRAKASPLRDVAGMLRSFDYAAETIRRGGDPDLEAVDAWYRGARDAFMAGYDDVIAGDEVLTRGWDPVSRSAVLAAFEVHKALYETRYELNNRPDWLDIPLNALRRIAGVADAQ